MNNGRAFSKLWGKRYYREGYPNQRWAWFNVDTGYEVGVFKDSILEWRWQRHCKRADAECKARELRQRWEIHEHDE